MRGPLPRLRSYGYAISAEAQNPDACWQWITFLSNEIPPGLIPARAALLESKAYEDQVGLDVANVAVASLEDAEIVSFLNLFMGFRVEMQTFVRAIERIQRGEMTAEEAMDWAQDRAAR